LEQTANGAPKVSAGQLKIIDVMPGETEAEAEARWVRSGAERKARADRAEAARLRGLGRVAEADALEESAAEAEKPYASVEAREPIQ